jgi:hypothetical protein
VGFFALSGIGPNLDLSGKVKNLFDNSVLVTAKLSFFGFLIGEDI